MNAAISCDRESGRGRRPLRQARRRLRSNACAGQASNSKRCKPPAPGEATELARDAYAQGFRNFLAVGGDGTSYEIVNGLFPKREADGRPTLGFLPLGTGNSFLRDFTTRGVEHTIEALRNGQPPRLRRDPPAPRATANFIS